MATDRAQSTSPSRWPAWVYEQGTEPDYRFSFANERTFLAWVRTALALLAAGVAIDAFPLDLAEEAQRAVAALLTCSGIGSAVIGWTQWARSERAIRRGRPLPSNPWSPLLCVVLAVVGGIVVVSLG